MIGFECSGVCVGLRGLSSCGACLCVTYVVSVLCDISMSAFLVIRKRQFHFYSLHDIKL